ncbi:hypothetical protein NSS79_02500 [Paenibacillus sp. FSL L8-0436]|uniref:hypothetical protein n=1 Tax=Paenibacillus sp. FSL L8-0436 TaxID=2954686 RepID=UPI0031582992
MKKKVIGIAAAALLLGGSIGYTASSSLIGAKVTGVFSVEQNGKKIADAVIINGSTYAPVRAISEATGTGLAVEGKKIIMSETTTAVAETVSATPADLQEKKASAEADIQRLERGIKDIEENVLPGLRDQAQVLSTNGAIGERAKQTLVQYEKQLKEDKAELTFLQARLAEIKAQLGE